MNDNLWSPDDAVTFYADSLRHALEPGSTVPASEAARLGGEYRQAWMELLFPSADSGWSAQTADAAADTDGRAR